MDCYSFDKIMSDYIDASLSVKQRQEADQHLSVCSRCSAKLVDMKSILTGLRALPQAKTSNDFESKLMDRIANEKEPGESRFIRVFQDYSRPISVVAAVFLLVATSIFVYTSVVIPNANGSLPTAEIRSTAPVNTMQAPMNVAASAQSAMAKTKSESVVPDSNKTELPNYNQQIMMVNENK